MLIAVEGIDGAGKTTIAAYIAELLKEKGYKVKVLKEPGDSKFGKKIKSSEERLSPEEELELFLKDREIDARENILPALQSGYAVVMDRYYFSNIAYQSARGIDARLIREMNEKIAPKPDLTILLDVEPEIALERVRKRGKLSPFEKLDYLRKVRKCFLENADETTVVVDASKPLEEVKEEVRKVIESFLNLKKNSN
ncbi:MULTISPECIES: dTMP kinase [Archaeoglobus]|jgi:dTMP kinase|uniref:Probable thymidylate kinase n=2 Tax=Archaeoglobus fulgidus TaxID=2234 RepID=KTHY_ARCFU|nr:MULTISPECIES: dTMP kinase [Archaeoglobus]O30175.1 RecName: Full=Probable thymidylate kinase; AltName: Full=dTMP kinase [Archaeoglobus fulgidus DSM 4304]AAB91163.1 thymidylate kinase (tmk) [Archaeoglobus fulgidus DSM 4304]KUJ94605.1 MAG: putative thymidylate kinase [Archaeoglobus fulgidus]KUK07491.1 MAG: putative thymidylate kinase [Archaeoglobus fulgidus]MDI3497087.1 dTMP kinase [Archaeoglobus sp.]